jgi:NADPH2:quinone reductase
VHSDELSLKPASLSWEEAAAVPLSGMTAVQAFERAALQLKTGTAKKVLITGASGGVGLVLIQLAVGAGHHVIAASSSRLRDEALLQSLHVNDHVEYARMESLGEIDVVIDTVGGDVLKRCWKVIAQDGALVSIDSASFNFVEEHKDIARAHSKAQAHAEFFIVEPRRKDLEHLTSVVEAGGLKIWIAQTFPLEAARQAYELVQSGTAGRGKVVLKV